jgi:hypothetical protein
MSWDKISDEVMDVQFGSLPLLTTEAFQAFLPAWLLRSLAGLDLEEHKVREWTLGQLTVYHEGESEDEEDLTRAIDRVRSRADALTRDQVESVRDFLELMREKAAVSDWDRGKHHAGFGSRLARLSMPSGR